jgi:D-inositol-3-phosphate glycosyltransferase
MMKHILLIVDHFYPYIGGNETLYFDVTRGLVQAGHRVTVVTRRDAGMCPQEDIHGVKVHRVTTPDFAQRLFFMLLALPLLWRLSRDASVVHAVVYGSALPGWLIAKLRRLPFVLTVHEVFGPKWRQLTGVGPAAAAMLRAFEWLLLRLPGTHYTCGAQFTADKLTTLGGIASERISVVPYVVDYDFWKPGRFQPRDLRSEISLPTTTFLYLYYGRPGPSKGVEVLVAAAAEVASRLPNSRLILLLGKEPADRHQAILEQIAELKLTDYVTVLDSRPRAELPTYLLASDCVVVPSHSEGFGYSAVEAATIGCRVLSTSGHSVEEVLQGEVELTPPNDPHSMADRLVEIASGPVERRYAAPRYTIAAHIEKIVRLYERVGARPNSAAKSHVALTSRATEAI